MDFQLMLENAQDENERKDLIMLEAELIGQYINQMTVSIPRLIEYATPLPAPAAYDDYNENADDDSVNNIIESILSGNL